MHANSTTNKFQGIAMLLFSLVLSAAVAGIVRAEDLDKEVDQTLVALDEHISELDGVVSSLVGRLGELPATDDEEELEFHRRAQELQEDLDRELEQVLAKFEEWFRMVDQRIERLHELQRTIEESALNRDVGEAMEEQITEVLDEIDDLLRSCDEGVEELQEEQHEVMESVERRFHRSLRRLEREYFGHEEGDDDYDDDEFDDDESENDDEFEDDEFEDDEFEDDEFEDESVERDED